MMPQLLFILLLVIAATFFLRSTWRFLRILQIGQSTAPYHHPLRRLREVLFVALGQQKMVKRPIAGALHILVYLGFVIINLEVIEITLDGIFGTHRIMSTFMGVAYSSFISVFELFALAVLLASIIFLIRRNLLKISRFTGPEMNRWPKLDANIILLSEIILMAAFLVMNTADSLLAQRGIAPYLVGSEHYWVSSQFQFLLTHSSDTSLTIIERSSWWLHITGILLFLNFIPYSKHLHIFLAMPNVYFSKLGALGQLNNMPQVTHEVKLMLGLVQEDPNTDTPEFTLGAKDIADLTWKNILDAYTCTECGRCTDQCPAHATGKILSPRKIMMNVRHRAEQLASPKRTEEATSNSDLFTLISPEELWACTTCNQCAETCPLNINQVDIIMQLRRYLVMEQNTAPSPLNSLFTNIENNGAPWQYAQADRANWTNELYTNTH